MSKATQVSEWTGQYLNQGLSGCFFCLLGHPMRVSSVFQGSQDHTDLGTCVCCFWSIRASERRLQLHYAWKKNETSSFLCLEEV